MKTLFSSTALIFEEGRLLQRIEGAIPLGWEDDDHLMVESGGTTKTLRARVIDPVTAATSRELPRGVMAVSWSLSRDYYLSFGRVFRTKDDALVWSAPDAFGESQLFPQVGTFVGSNVVIAADDRVLTDAL